METRTHVQQDADDSRPPPPETSTLLLNGALAGDDTLEPIEEALFTLLREARTAIRGYQMRDIPLAH